MPTNSSISMYDTFGNEVSYRINAGVVEAYIENSTIKFPLPEASSDILGGLVVKSKLNPELVELVKAKLKAVGFKDAKATVMAQILTQVAENQGVHPFEYFDNTAAAVKLTQDGYATMNKLRPKGNRVGIKSELKNSKSRYKDTIRP